MRLFLQKSLLPLFLLCGCLAGGQVRFSASVSPAELAELKFVVENADEVQQIEPPSLKNFSIVAGPSQQSGMSIVNGIVKKYIALTYIIRPKNTGVFLITPATAKADGAVYKSNAASIKVIAGATGNATQPHIPANPFTGMGFFDEPAPRAISRDFILKKGEDPLEKVNRNMFVILEVDRKTCYVGEPLVATYKLYTRLKSESNMVKNPSFNGFSVIDLQQPDHTNYHIEKKDGKEYNVYIIRKAQLYPLLPGNLELGVTEIENNVQFIKAEYINQRPDFLDGTMPDFFDGAIPPEGLVRQKLSLQNKPVSIQVKPLPETNKPADFKGAVGNFSIEAKLEKDNFTTDDGGRLAIIIGGEGNLQMMNAPDITWPAGVEGFDVKTTEDLLKGMVPVGGRKIFEFPFTVAAPGSYTIPPVTISFFNPQQGAYKIIQSRPLSITVAAGSGKPAYSKLKAETVKEDSYLVSFFKNRLRVVSVVAVLILLGLIFWLKKDKKKEERLAIEKKAIQEAEEKTATEKMEAQQHPFIKTADLLYAGDGKTFYVTLNEELKNFISKKFSIPAEELNRRSITTRMDKLGIPNQTALQLYRLIDEVEFELYTPVPDEDKKQVLYDKANEIVEAISAWHNQA
jgi:hypothetical protein